MVNMDKEMTKKYLIAGIAGMIVGIILGFVGGYAFLALVIIIVGLTAYKYYRVKNGEIIEPYGLIEKIQYTAVGVIVAVIFYSLIAVQYLVGIFLCVGIILLAAALIHAIRTDVLAMDN
ncbi:hypothetical protein LJX78_06570 [Methanimicrococcus blatticola]|uniref:hypothetical protein n=1 Tax=Methanimicrococcus blatticola TaxID=91560 RepID=UPI001CBC7343|nr:hypothetical protein [Methanimicrococcus blatticola]MBZ3935622.1 hypothetical protein [Methanimicrococcus blatticola]MCC2509263.1 hypothetical protein [Methanimicrococcus blatticola]